MTRFIEPQALKRAQADDHAPLVIDVRSADEYAAGHVPGAVHIPIDQLDARLDELPQDRPVVPYCNMYHPGSSRGERAAELLTARGFEARVLNGGFPAWHELDETKAEEDPHA